MKFSRKSLYFKLILSFIGVAFSATAIAAIFVRFTTTDSLAQFLVDQQRSSMVQSLINYYTLHGSWDGVEESWDDMQRQTIPTPNPPSPTREPVPAPNPLEEKPFVEKFHRNLFGLADMEGNIIVSVDPDYLVGSHLPPETFSQKTVIEVNGKEVGTILTARHISRFSPEEALFLERTNQALLISIFTGLLVAVVIGTVLARKLTLPLRDLTKASEKIAKGQLEQEVKVTSKDEIGQLAEAFNQMSREVARVNALRRQMTADIAHDLRTPLTVIAGYIESMQDGVLQPTPERFEMIYKEIARLQNLVGDLRMLSQADAGELSLQPQEIQPKNLLDQAAALFQHHAERHSVNLRVDAADDLPTIYVDEARMMQVLDNLITNALRYTPENGQIVLGGRLVNGKVELSVEDNGCGIAAKDLPLIFDRFHRADKSRHTDEGESGLGLAIVKALVESQGGTVWAESEVGKGSVFKMRF
ncbi:MAG: HAMP domain-containing protein [Chloroflexi bacterium]|nr:HAMP domain-containing protein [Chloroflexota bacterium]